MVGREWDLDRHAIEYANEVHLTTGILTKSRSGHTRNGDLLGAATQVSNDIGIERVGRLCTAFRTLGWHF